MAVANVDAHVSVPAAAVTAPGTLVAIMGTSICHIVLSDEAPAIAGICGVVRDGVIPGYYGFKAGQPAVGDLLRLVRRARRAAIGSTRSSRAGA